MNFLAQKLQRLRPFATGSMKLATQISPLLNFLCQLFPEISVFIVFLFFANRGEQIYYVNFVHTSRNAFN